MLSRTEKAVLRAHWRYLRLRFTAAGVMAQQSIGGAWGLLMSNAEARKNARILIEKSKGGAS